MTNISSKKVQFSMSGGISRRSFVFTRKYYTYTGDGKNIKKLLKSFAKPHPSVVK